MLEAYKQQDLKKLYDFFREDEEFEGMEEDFLIKRNIKWITGISNTIKKQAAFIAVGAGHLYGEEGLIFLLRKKGYTVSSLATNNLIHALYFFQKNLQKSFFFFVGLCCNYI